MSKIPGTFVQTKWVNNSLLLKYKYPSYHWKPCYCEIRDQVHFSSLLIFQDMWISYLEHVFIFQSIAAHVRQFVAMSIKAFLAYSLDKIHIWHLFCYFVKR